jgi:hypothetical protein
MDLPALVPNKRLTLYKIIVILNLMFATITNKPRYINSVVLTEMINSDIKE